jgi:hypothetical protein
MHCAALAAPLDKDEEEEGEPDSPASVTATA